jgi:tetratricopeptide (TPR) repeat protein
MGEKEVIKFVRITTFVAAAAILTASFFVMDANHELSLASRAYRHYDMDQAMRHARRALLAAGNHKETRFQALGIEVAVAEKLRKKGKALEYLSEMTDIELPASCISCYLKRGKLRYELGDYKGALRDLNIGLKNTPPIRPKQAARYYAWRGLSSLALGDNRKAQEDAETALSLDNNAPLPHFLKSSCLNREGNHAGAFREAKIAYEIAKKQWGFFNSIEGKKWLHYYVAVMLQEKKK